MEILDLISEQEYYKTFFSLKKLQVTLPPECKLDVEKEYAEAEKIVYKKVEATTAYFATNLKKNQLYKEAPNVLLGLMGSVIESLFRHGWINKSFNLNPINRNTPHIKSDP